jgi:hypothetical protein
MGHWIDILSNLNLTDTDPEDKRYGGFTESEKKNVIARNAERKIIRDFLADLKKKRDENKQVIKDAYGKEYPFPELLELPGNEKSSIRNAVWRIVEKYENKELYYTLLKNNNQPNYQQIVWRISDDHRRDNVVIKLDYSKNEDSLLHMLKSAIMLCPPASVQNEFEYFAEQWAELENIDSKKEEKEKRSEILSEFHKAMRQTDMFGNGYACNIIYGLWDISDIVYRVLIAVTEQLKEEKEFSK